MVKTSRWLYRAAFTEILRHDNTPTFRRLGAEVGVGYSAAYRAAQLLRLPCARKEDLSRLGYYAAVVRAKKQDPDGLATVDGIAAAKEVTLETVHDFFARHQNLKDAWGVLNRSEALKQRCRLAAGRFRSRHPRKRLRRADLARELGWSSKKLYSYLRAHPELVDELKVVYTYSRYREKKV